MNGSFCIVSGGVIDDDLQRTIIHVCSAHMMNLCKKHASNKAYKDSMNRSQVHFAMRVFGRLINCTRLSDASKVVKCASVVMMSEYATNDTKNGLKLLEETISSFKEITEDGVALDLDEMGTGGHQQEIS